MTCKKTVMCFGGTLNLTQPSHTTL